MRSYCIILLEVIALVFGGYSPSYAQNVPRVLKSQTFTTTGTWRVRPNVKELLIDLCASGGGGGGSHNTGGLTGHGGGGGAGTLGIHRVVSVTPGLLVTVTIGTTGVGGGTDVDGTAGGSVVVSGSGFSFTEHGGRGGVKGDGTNPGAGGAATFSGKYVDETHLAGIVGDSSGTATDNTISYIGGTNGTSTYGGGGGGAGALGNGGNGGNGGIGNGISGTAASGYCAGGGGAGGATSGSNAVGGNATGGKVVLRWVE